MPQSLLIAYYSRNVPGFYSTILRRRKRNLFYCATCETVWSPAPADVNNPNHSSRRTLSSVWNGDSFLLRRWMEVSAEVWLEKATFLLFLFHHLPARSRSCSWEPTEKPLAGKVTRGRFAAHVSLFSELVHGLSIAQALYLLVLKVKKKKKSKKPLTYLHSWGTNLNFVVTSEWISKIHWGRRKGEMGETARVLEMRSFRKERKIEEEGELEEFCFRKGPAVIRLLQGIIGIMGLCAGLGDPLISCSLFHYSLYPQGIGNTFSLPHS